MIGSLMSRMGMAEKLSVAQLQKAVQDGTLPAYVGVPLIQDKLKQAQEAKAAGAQQPHQPPIAQQVMQAAEQHGIDEAQSNLPTQEMAGGGIVAFASGDLVEDDDEEDTTTDEDRQRAELMGLMSSAQDRLQSGIESGHGIGSLAAVPTAKEAKETAFKINPESKGGIGIKDVLAAKAAEHKLPPDLLNKIAGIESGYKSTAANPNSTAKGLFQFTDATWKGMGGKEGEQFDPEKNAELGAKFVRQNAEGLKGALGRNPTYGEVYASHMFGLKGAKDLLNLDPRTPMDKAVSAQVLKANPQLRDKTVGQVMASLNNKMGEGIVALAKGGAIKHYANDGLVDLSPPPTYTPSEKPDTELVDTIDPMSGDILKVPVDKKKAAAATAKQESKKAATSPGLTYEEMLAGSSRAGTQAAMDKDETSGIAIPPIVPKEEGKGVDSLVNKEPSFEQKYMELLKGREAGTAKQRSIDNYMSLLQAGLGMMGGTSPYAMANIGQGAATGIAAKMAAEKNRIAEEAATMKGYGNLYTTQQAAGLRRDLAGQSSALQREKTLGAMEQKEMANVLAQNKLDMSALSDTNLAAKIQAQVKANLAKNAGYTKMYQDVYGVDYAAAPVSGGPTDYTGKYGLAPKPQ